MGGLASSLSFQGRASRVGFWRWNLALTAMAGALMAASVFVTLSDLPGSRLVAAVLLFAILPLLLAGLAIAVRRLHDRNKGAWWILIFGILPYLLDAGASALVRSHNALALLAALLMALAALVLALWSWVELGFLGGARGADRFGKPPARL